MHQHFHCSEQGADALCGFKVEETLEAGRLRSIFEASMAGMALLDLSGFPQVSNPALQQMLQYTGEELGKMALVELLHPDDAAGFNGRFQELIQAKRDHYHAEKRFFRKDGKVLWGGLTASLVRDSFGQPQNVVCLVEDITERAHSQRAIRKAAAFAEFNPNPIFEFSPEGELRYFNKAAKDLARLVGKEDPFGILPEETQEVVSHCWMSGKSKLRLTTQLRERTVSWSFFPIPSIGKVHCYACDITERLALEEQLRQSQKLEAIGQLAAGVAHDFNNILTVIQGNASMFSVVSAGSPEAKECADQIVYAAERAASLTSQLLAFSRKQLLHLVNLDLNEVVEHMTRMLQRLLGEHIVLRSDLASGLPLTHADHGMLEQVLMNLAVNARDAMPDGGQLLIKTQEASFDEANFKKTPRARPGRFVCLSVQDTGCGISAENLERIFEPFFTTKEIGKGTGLGLPTVYGIVHQHHGWVDVSSQMGQGSTFKIYLPAIRQSAPEPVIKSAAT